MPTKGRDISVKEKRGRSPMLPRKVEIARSLSAPSTLERKDSEPRKVPIYEKHTVSSSIYARSAIKHPYVDNTKLVPQSKVMSLRSKFNEKRFTNSSTKTKDVRKPHIVHGKKQTRQPTDGSESKTIVVAKSPKLFNDHNVVTNEDNDHKTTPFVDNDVLTLEKCDTRRMDHEDDDISEDGGECPLHEPSVITTSCESINIEHVDDGHDEGINQPCFEGDQKVQEVELGSKDEGHEETEAEEPEPMEQEIKEGGEKVPEEEDRRSNEVVDHGKMDIAACKNVIEATISELQQQRWNRVKALVGTFESIISLECETLQKSIKQH